MQILLTFDLVLLLIAFFSIPISCDVQIVEPKPGLSYDLSSGSANVRLEWLLTEDGFSEEDITEYVFTLVSGPNAKIEAMSSLGTVAASALEDLQRVFAISNTVGSDGEYYFQVLAMTDEGFSILYSNRFLFTGMVGEKKVVNSNDRRPPLPEIRMNTMDAPIEINSASFTIPYNQQNGRAKFAPMQQPPLTKVTATSWRRIHETSAFTYYSTIQQSVDKITTITPGLSYQYGTGANFATPAPMPQENGHWYHPSKRQSLTPRKRNL